MSKIALVTSVMVGVAVSLTACTIDVPQIGKVKIALPQIGNSASLSEAEQAKAVALREQALEVQLLTQLRAMRAANPNNPNEPFQLLELVKLYDTQKKFNKAIVMMKRAKESWRRTHNKAEAGVTYLLTTESNLLAHMGRIYDAERLQLQVLGINQKVLTADSPKLVPTLRQVASFYAASGNFRKAESFFKRAVAICDKYPEEVSRSAYTELLKSYTEVHGQANGLRQAAKNSKPVI